MSLKWNVTKNELSLKTECHSKGNDTENGLSIKKNVIQNLKSLNVTQNGMSFKMEKGISLEMKCHSKWNVTQKGCHLK